MAEKTVQPINSACIPAEISKKRLRPGSGRLCATAVIFLPGARPRSDGLGDHADIYDAGLAQLVHHGGEAAEGHGLVAAHEHRVARGSLDARFDQRADVVD